MVIKKCDKKGGDSFVINYIINSYTKEKKSTHEKLDVGKELKVRHTT